jgi:hypothetical protein
MNQETLKFYYNKFLDSCKDAKLNDKMPSFSSALKNRDGQEVIKRGNFCFFAIEGELDTSCLVPLAMEWCSTEVIEEILRGWKNDSKSKGIQLK